MENNGGSKTCMPWEYQSLISVIHDSCRMLDSSGMVSSGNVKLFVYWCLWQQRVRMTLFNALRLRQNGCNFTGDILNTFPWMKILEFIIGLDYGLAPNRLKPLSETMMAKSADPFSRHSAFWIKIDLLYMLSFETFISVLWKIYKDMIF